MTEVSGAQDIRATFYDKMGITIMNHTVPDYASAFALSLLIESLAAVTISYLSPVSQCEDSDASGKYRNLFDGTAPHGVKRQVRSQSAKVVDSERYKQLNLVQKCVATAAAICGYVKSRAAADDLNTEELWAIFCVAWGVSGVEVPPFLGLTYRADAATKQLGIRVSKTSHVLLPFPNARECLQVDTSRLTR